jgi:hypothetical protein
VKEAFAGVGRIADELDVGGPVAAIGRRGSDEVEPLWMIFLADEVYVLPFAADRCHDGASPEVASRPVEQPAVEQG